MKHSLHRAETHVAENGFKNEMQLAESARVRYIIKPHDRISAGALVNKKKSASKKKFVRSKKKKKKKIGVKVENSSIYIVSPVDRTHIFPNYADGSLSRKSQRETFGSAVKARRVYVYI